MKKISCFMFLLLFIACNKPKDIDPGIIVSEMNMNPLLNIEFLPFDQYVFSNDSVYREVLNPFLKNSSLDLPEIDFSQYSLLLYKAMGQCEAEFYYAVHKDDIKGCYKCIAYVYEKGRCKRAVYCYKYLLVPRLPFGYKVEFESQKK